MASSCAASLLRGRRGRHANGAVHRQPATPIELYEFEGCPYGRLVREALTELDLDVLIHPCPEKGTRFRPRARELGGKLQFPFLVDPNTGRRQHESAQIVAYLAETYGGSVMPARGLARRLAVASSYLVTLIRGLRGVKARASRPPGGPLELFGFEGDPATRLVREALCELELEYVLRNAADPRGRNREKLLAQTGRDAVPCLTDAGAGVAPIFGTREILRHLEQRYATGSEEEVP